MFLTFTKLNPRWPHKTVCGTAAVHIQYTNNNIACTDNANIWNCNILAPLQRGNTEAAYYLQSYDRWLHKTSPIYMELQCIINTIKTQVQHTQHHTCKETH